MARNAGSSYPSYLTYPAYLSYLLVLTCAARISAHDPITTKVTWSREVVRIVNKSCTGCHVAGGVAPMPLSTYDEARPWAKAIKDEVVARRMPKWPAARGFGHFSNDPSLSPFEIELIAAWADGGAPKGEERDLPAKIAGAAVEEPDLVFTLPVRTAPPAGESRTATLVSTTTRDRWITGWEFLPNDGAIVAAQFELIDDELLGNWAPPEDRVKFPTDAGQRLPAGATVLVTLTYRRDRMQRDFPVRVPSKPPVLGLFLNEKPPPLEVRHLQLACGERRVTFDREIPKATVFAVRVDGAAPGKPIGLQFISSPQQRAQPIVWIREFDPSYQPTYRLAAPQLGLIDGLLTESAIVAPECRATWDYTARRGSSR